MNKYFKAITGAALAAAFIAVLAVIPNHSAQAGDRISWFGRTNVTVVSNSAFGLTNVTTASQSLGNRYRTLITISNTNLPAETIGNTSKIGARNCDVMLRFDSLFRTNELYSGANESNCVVDAVIHGGQTLSIPILDGYNGAVTLRCPNTNVDLNVIYSEAGY